MKRILAIQHIECEPLGLFEELASGMAEFVYVRPFRHEPLPDFRADFDGIIVLGGPMAVYDAAEHEYLKSEIELIRAAIDADFPTLGICLGAQLIAAAAGARVYPGPVREIGWADVNLTEAAIDDDLFCGLPSPLPVFQLHGDTFDLPPGSARLAGNKPFPNQAFRVGQCVYGLQFHVEVNGGLITDWVSFYGDYISQAGARPAKILENLTEKTGRLRPVAEHIITRFLGLRQAGQLSP